MASASGSESLGRVRGMVFAPRHGPRLGPSCGAKHTLNHELKKSRFFIGATAIVSAITRPQLRMAAGCAAFFCPSPREKWPTSEQWNGFMRHVRVLLMIVMSFGVSPGVEAASCSKDDFGKAVDQAGAALRKLNADNAPRLRAKMRELKDRKAWSDTDFEEKALAAVQDERIEGYNAQANDLLAKLDALGSIEPATEADCGKIEELAAASLELQATIKAKAAYTLSKLDQMLAPAPPTPVPADKGRAGEVAKPRAEAAKPPPPPPAPAAAPKVGAAGKPPEASGWSAQTKSDPSREVAVLQPPAQGPLAPMPPGNLAPDEDGY